jgi:hypothetical protein
MHFFNDNLFFRTVGLTAHEIMRRIEEAVDDDDEEKGEEAQKEPVNIILFPAADEVITDEDSEDEEDEGDMSKDPNHLGKDILNQQAEMERFGEEFPDVTKVSSPPTYRSFYEGR